MKRGFTLIELLVVISIISLLSSIILGSLSDAKTKAANARIVSEIDENIKTLIFYHYSDGLGYPPTDGTSCCLGNYLNNKCEVNDSLDDTGNSNCTELKNVIHKYRPSSSDGTIVTRLKNGGFSRGAWYYAISGCVTNCSPNVVFDLKGNVNCPRFPNEISMTTIYNSNTETTRCTFFLN